MLVKIHPRCVYFRLINRLYLLIAFHEYLIVVGELLDGLPDSDTASDSDSDCKPNGYSTLCRT